MNGKHYLRTLLALLAITGTLRAGKALDSNIQMPQAYMSWGEIASSEVAFKTCAMTLPALPILSVQDGELNENAIREAANRVMQQHDYRSVRRRMLENIPATENDNSSGFLMDSLKAIGGVFSDFIEWLFSGLFQPRNTPTPPATSSPPAASSSGGGFGLGDALLFLGLAIVILVAIWLIAVVFKMSDGQQRRNRSGLFDDSEDLANLDTPPGELAASTYESRALQFAGNGNYRAAIRELLIGSMSWIERAGLIRFRKGLTNRDYVRAIWRQEDRREAYIKTAFEFERIYFGRRDATDEMFRVCLKLFQEAFREEESTAKV